MKNPSLCFHKGSGQWCVYVNRKRVYLGSDEAKARKRHERLTGDCYAESNIVTRKVTALTDALATYSKHATAYYAGDTRTLNHIRKAMAAILDAGLDCGADEFRARTLKLVRDGLVSRGTLSRNYINKLIGYIQTAFTWLASEEIVSAECAASLRTVKALRAGKGGLERPRVAPVDPEVVAATMPELGPTIRAMVELQQLTGMRPGEVCGMRTCDIAMEGKIQVPGSDRTVGPMSVLVDGISRAVWIYAPAGHKNLHRGKARLIPLGPRAQDILRPHLEMAGFLFAPVDGKYENGERYTVSSYARAIARAVERVNKGRHPPLVAEPIPHWSPNQLRHALATEAGERFDEATAAAMLGHSAAGRVIDTYMEQSMRKAAQAAAQIG